ncbi:MAG TPA: hypothetical protein VKR58_12235 [Aquella sp.]|nr:hypothetical protein [Aquella sp.]
MKFEWDIINEFCNWGSSYFYEISRVKVHRGWLVRETRLKKDFSVDFVTMTFVPDWNHEWKIDDE